MSFWSTSTGESAVTADTSFDAGGGSMEPMPDGTTVLAMPDDVKWANDRQEVEHLSIRWTVLKPEAYQNRKIFHKLYVSDEDHRAKDPAKKRDKALKMLAAIDANAGGKLGKIGGKPTDDQLALALTNKQMTLRLGVWELEGDNGPISGNWVSQVADKTKPVTEVAKPKTVARKAAPIIDDDDDDMSVPF